MNPVPRRLRPALVCLLLAAGMACGRAHDRTARANGGAAIGSPEQPLVFSGPPGRHGGRMVVSTLAAPKTFNVLLANESTTTDVLGLLFDGLTQFDNVTQEVGPGLATSWETSPDGRRGSVVMP